MKAQLGGSSHVPEFADVLLKVGEAFLSEDNNGHISISVTLGTVIACEEELIRSLFGDHQSIMS